MSAQPLDQQTYLPGPPDEVGVLLTLLKDGQGQGGAESATQLFLAGEDGKAPLPQGVKQALLQVLQAMEAGRAVTIAPQKTVITTQQAADLLGVSRPTVVRLVEEGLLPAETPGQRRRLLKLDDVLAYRVRRRDERYRALFDDELDQDSEEALEQAEARHRKIRAEVAERRRRARNS